MVVWDNLWHPDVKEYLNAYWAHQRAYRAAVEEVHREQREGKCAHLDKFPVGSFHPNLPVALTPVLLERGLAQAQETARLAA